MARVESESDADPPAPEIGELVYTFVRTVPPGKVVTYGQVAASIEGVSLTARQVGAIMRYAPDDVPWQRVVGAEGRLPISKRSPEAALLQRRLLQQEGVPFYGEEADRIDMTRAQWQLSGERALQGDLFDD